MISIIITRLKQLTQILFVLLLSINTLSAAESCTDNFKNDFQYGASDTSTNGEVSKLQNFLGINKTGVFDNLTAKALLKFQVENNIVASIFKNKLKNAYFGPITRQKINSTCIPVSPVVSTVLQSQTLQTSYVPGAQYLGSYGTAGANGSNGRDGISVTNIAAANGGFTYTFSDGSNRFVSAPTITGIVNATDITITNSARLASTTFTDKVAGAGLKSCLATEKLMYDAVTGKFYCGNDLIGSSGSLASGTLNNSSLRWNGNNWTENAGFTSDGAGNSTSTNSFYSGFVQALSSSFVNLFSSSATIDNLTATNLTLPNLSSGTTTDKILVRNSITGIVKEVDRSTFPSAGAGGVNTYTSLTDAVTANLPVLNTPLSNSLNTINTNINSKQSTLQSGTNIKTINGNSVLGGGDLVIVGGGGNSSWGSITGTLSNQADLATALANKQNTLTSSSNLIISTTVANGGTSQFSDIDFAHASGTSFEAQVGSISDLSFDNLSGNTGTINSLGINTTGVLTATLQVNGTAGNNTGVWGTFSDARSKENVKNYDRGLADLLKLNPVTFNYKSSFGIGTSTHVGFIAQDLQVAIPEMVTNIGTINGVDNFLENNQEGIVQLAINSIKELAQKFIDLANEIVTKTIKTSILCIGNECLNELQIKQIKASSGITAVTTDTSATTSSLPNIVINLLGDNPQIIASTSILTYTDPGATSVDDLGNSIIVNSNVLNILNASTTPGTYIINYTASTGTISTSTNRTIIVN